MTYADNALAALGMSRNRRHEPVAPSPTPHRLPATDFIAKLEPGDQLRDHGRLRTVAAARCEPSRLACIEVRFADGGDLLTIALDGDVTIWRAVNHA